MKILAFLIAFLLCATLQAESRVETIARFSGLNTAAGNMGRKPNEGVTCNNIDLSRYGVGTMAKRFGYDSVSWLAGMDECVGLNAFYPSDDRQFLGSVWDSAGVGYGGIYMSPEGKDYFTGTQSFRLYSPNLQAGYIYVDSFFLNNDTIVISYTSDGTPTLNEIYGAFYNLIDTTDGLDGYFTPRYFLSGGTGGGGFVLGVYADEAVEFLGSTVTCDTGQTIDTIADYIGKIWSYYSIQNRPWFAQFNDEWFVVNGAQKGVRWNGDVARSWPPNAPGEPSIIPLADDGPIDGEVLYCFRFARTNNFDSLGSPGYVSAPVRVKNGQVMLKDFWWPATDSGRAATDTVLAVGYRTRANPGIITGVDYAFYFDTIALVANAASLAAVIYIDSISDDGLSSTDSVQLEQLDQVGRNSTGVRDVRYGAPGFLDIPTWAYQGIFRGMPQQKDTLGVAYRVTTFDSLSGMESDGGPLCYVWVDADSTSGNRLPGAIQLSLPFSPGPSYLRNLYRAHILQIVKKTGGQGCIAWWGSAGIDEDAVGRGYYGQDGLDSLIALYGVPLRISCAEDAKWKWRYIVDTIFTSEFRFVAQIKNDTNIYTDVTTYDSLLRHDVYRAAVPPLLAGAFSYDNYLWGWDGARLYWSDLDSVANWGAFSRMAIDPDDGDQITVCFPTRAGIRILKNYSTYTVYDAYSKYEKVGDWGCIAPHSYAAAENGHFYLSARGVVFETEGMQLERTVVSGLVSKKLRNFDIMSLETKRGATGAWLPNVGKYLLCIGDTTYVYDKRASDLLGEEVWSTWTNLTFTTGTLYNVEDNLAFLPGNDFYFVKDNDSRLMHYGTSEYDLATKVPFVWQNANMFPDPGFKSQVMGIGVRGYDAVATDTLLIALIDESGAVIGLTYADSLNQRYRPLSFAPNTSLEFGLILYNGALTVNYFSGYIERIDMFFEPRIEPIMWR